MNPLRVLSLKSANSPARSKPPPEKPSSAWNWNGRALEILRLLLEKPEIRLQVGPQDRTESLEERYLFRGIDC